jgi:hypothetical protein
MTTRIILVASAVIVAVGTIGYYLVQERAAPSVAPAALQQPSAPPAAIADSPKEHSRQIAESRATAPASQLAVVGGETIPLHFQMANRPKSRVDELDDGKSGGFFEPLAAAARSGNDVAAHHLYEALRDCAPHPKTRAEFDARVAGLQKWFQQTGGVADGEVVDLEKTKQNLQRLYKRCEGVTQEMLATATELLRESVDRGYDDNRLLYAVAIRSTDPKEAHAQFEALWQRGYIDGLRMLGADSLPHQIASLAAESAQFSGRSEPAFAQAAAQASERLAALEAKTSPSEFRAASEEAARILHNPNCCK